MKESKVVMITSPKGIDMKILSSMVNDVLASSSNYNSAKGDAKIALNIFANLIRDALDSEPFTPEPIAIKPELPETLLSPTLKLRLDSRIEELENKVRALKAKLSESQSEKPSPDSGKLSEQIYFINKALDDAGITKETNGTQLTAAKRLNVLMSRWQQILSSQTSVKEAHQRLNEVGVTLQGTLLERMNVLIERLNPDVPVHDEKAQKEKPSLPEAESKPEFSLLSSSARNIEAMIKSGMLFADKITTPHGAESPVLYVFDPYTNIKPAYLLQVCGLAHSLYATLQEAIESGYEIGGLEKGYD